MNAFAGLDVDITTSDPLRTVVRSLARVPVTLLVGLAGLAIAVVPAAGEWFQLDRAAVAVGEIWRLGTCHLSHWNAEHLEWDLLMFLVIGGACELRNPRQMRCCVAAAASVVSGLVWYCFPGVQAYRGLSGIDTALFTLLATNLVFDARRDANRLLTLVAGGLLAGFAAKTAFEAAFGQTYFVDQHVAGFSPLVWDHIAAAVVGAMFALASWSREAQTSHVDARRQLPQTADSAGFFAVWLASGRE